MSRSRGRSASPRRKSRSRSRSRSHNKKRSLSRDKKPANDEKRCKSQKRDSRSKRRSPSKNATNVKKEQNKSKSRSRSRRSRSRRSRSRRSRSRSQKPRSKSRRRSQSRGGQKSPPRGRSASRRSHSRRNNDDSRSRSVVTKKVLPKDWGRDTMHIGNDDAAFILGKGGKTKEKIARVSDAHMELHERDGIIEISGSEQQRRRAMKYVRAVMSQRTGQVAVDERKDDDGDLTVFEVPTEAVGFVTGRQGNFLRSLELEWNVLMLFAEFDRSAHRKSETLAIFGSRRGRRGAELKALSAIDAKCPGFFESHRASILHRDDDGDNWGTSTMEFKQDELSYALGKKGATRRKIEASSGCITQYIGLTGLFAGTREERTRAKEYTHWLFEQLEGPVYVDRWEQRKDCTVLDIPQDCVGYVTGSRRAALGQMEEEFGVLMFFMGSKHERKETEQLIIFGPARGRLGAVLKVKSTVESREPKFYTRHLEETKSSEKGLAVDIMYLKDEEISYALGARGSTRKKLQTASGCILQYIGNYAHMAGERKERKRAMDYLEFLLAQRRGKVRVDYERRDDVLKVDVPTSAIGWVTGAKGSELRRVEEETGTFCFLASDRDNQERMLVFGHEDGHANKYGHGTGRQAAKQMILDLVTEKQRLDARGGRRSRSRGRDSRSRGRGFGRNRNDSRSPSRRRIRSPSRRGGGGGGGRGRSRSRDSRDSRR